MSKALRLSSYQKLVKDLRLEIASGISAMEKLFEKQKVLAYWSIGQSIHHYLKNNTVPQGGVLKFYDQLAKDLNTNPRTLGQFEQFSTLFSKSDLKDGLSWTHYRYLFTVSDKGERQKWIARALKNNWASKDLKMNLFLETKALTLKGKAATLERPKRGKLYTYRLVPVQKRILPECAWMVDCGFSNRLEAPKSKGELHNKRIYASIKTEQGYRLNMLKNVTVDQLYTYKANVLRVVDGDTLLVLIDQGFGIWTQQRLRLKDIDAPEMTSAKGRKAKEWVTQRLKNLSFVIVRTSKSDKYDRYLADIFYLPKEEDLQRVSDEGIFLNQELLDQGYAVLWK